MGSVHEAGVEDQGKPSTDKSAAKPNLRPNQDQDANVPDSPVLDPIPRREPRQVAKDIADADQKAREESGEAEAVRNTPPSGDWNDTSPDR